MNNGNFNGYDPNLNGQGNGYNGNYDSNAAYGQNGYGAGGYPTGNNYNAYQQGGSYDNSTSQGYRPYEGGTYSNPNSGAAQYGVNQGSTYASPYGNTAQNYDTSYNRGAPAASGSYSSTMTMADYSRRIFGWMGAGLTLTFVIAFGMMMFLTSGTYEDIYMRLVDYMPIFYVGIGFEFILAIVLSIFVRKMPHTVSLVMFVVYSVCNGLTITPLLVIYGAETAVYAFAAAAVLFITFAIYGMVTKRDLSKLGPILLIGLFVLIGYSLIAMLFGMSSDSLIVSLIGIAIFIGFTAYDTKKIKTGYEQFGGDEEMLKKSAVTLALELYLDFINLFLYLLRLMGSKR